MTEETIQQRIQYLVEHGGIYPRRPQPWVPWLIGLGMLQALTLAAVLLH